MPTTLGTPTVSAILFFFLIVGLTLAVTWWAARRTRSTKEFYAAGRSIGALQNGLALAGDYMSAASFLGIAGLVALKGYDGMIYATGWLVGWPALMFLIAEPLRNLGKYTFADVVAFRLRQTPVRIASAIGGILTVLLYTIAQMVGAGNLIKLMFGIPYEAAVVLVGAVMLAYVLFGGMIATTWVQIIKAVLLLCGVTLLTLLVLAQFHWSPGNLYSEVATTLGQEALEPGGLVSNPVDAISLGLALTPGPNMLYLVSRALAQDAAVGVDVEATLGVEERAGDLDRGEPVAAFLDVEALDPGLERAEDQQVQAQLRRIEVGVVADDHPFLLEPPHAFGAGGDRQPDALGELGHRQPPRPERLVVVNRRVRPLGFGEHPLPLFPAGPRHHGDGQIAKGPEHPFRGRGGGG